MPHAAWAPTSLRTPFAPPPGFVTDDTVFAAPGRWKTGSLGRFYQEQWQTLGGWESLTTSLLSGVCRWAFGWTDFSDVLNVAFGTHSHLQVWQGGELFDITPTSGFTVGAIDGAGGAGYGGGSYGTGTYSSPSTGDYFPLTWSGGAFGQALIANPRKQGIFIWANDTATPAALLSNAPAEVVVTLCLPQRQIMALGCNEEVSGDFDPICIRWSDIENPTVWASASDNNAGEYVLEGGGRIVGAAVVGNYVVCWTDVGIYLGTYIGDPGETWRFELVGKNCGLIGPNAFAVDGQTVAWVSPDAQFWSYTLGGAPEQLDSPIRKDFADNIAIGQQDKIVGATVGQFREIRWFYPDGRDGYENSRDIVLSDEGWWVDANLPRTAFIDAGPHVSPIGCTYAGNVYWHERGTSADSAILQGYVESTDFYIDEGEQSLLINGVWPNFKDQKGTLSLTIYTRNYPQDAERTHGPYLLTPGLSKKSFRLSGRIARLRFDFASSPAFARMGKLEFDTDAVGGR